MILFTNQEKPRFRIKQQITFKVVNDTNYQQKQNILKKQSSLTSLSLSKIETSTSLSFTRPEKSEIAKAGNQSDRLCYRAFKTKGKYIKLKKSKFLKLKAAKSRLGINSSDSTANSISDKDSLSSFTDDSSYNNGRWTEDEHRRFIEAIFKYGNEWKNVQRHIKSRSSTQSRSHSQKFFMKLKNYNIFDFKGKKPNITALIEEIKDRDEEEVQKIIEMLISYEYNGYPNVGCSENEQSIFIGKKRKVEFCECDEVVEKINKENDEFKNTFFNIFNSDGRRLSFFDDVADYYCNCPTYDGSSTPSVESGSEFSVDSLVEF